jgi:uncharacterized protein (DUF1697 family)
MPRLVQLCHGLGLSSVASYINSGNLVFVSTHQAQELEKRLSQAIEKEFGLQIPVLVRDASSVEQIVAATPAQWVNDASQKTDVILLRPDLDNANVVTAMRLNADIEQAIYTPGAIVWHIDRTLLAKSLVPQTVINGSFYGQTTVRNINTVRRLASLLAAIETD